MTEHVYGQLIERYPQMSDYARQRCREDLGFHLEFFTGALETGDRSTFEEYARWVRTVLESRGVPVGSLRVTFELLRDRLVTVLEGEARLLARDVFDAGIAALDEETEPDEATAVARDQLVSEVQELVASLVGGDRRTARRQLDENIDAGALYVDVGVNLLQPSMYEIGRLWQHHKVSVAQEHLATALTQSLLAHAFSRVEFGEPRHRKAIIACVEGNHHAVGARIVADSLEIAGWEVQYLGGNVPTTDLLRQVDGWKPDVVGLSVSLPYQVGVLRKSIERLRAEFGAQAPSLLVGGLTLNQWEEARKRVRADLWSPDAKSLVEEVEGP